MENSKAMRDTAQEYPDLIILGSTGSVGTQAADVAERHNIRVRGLSANRNSASVEKQARRFLPDRVVMTDPAAAADLRVRLADTSVSVQCGFEGIRDMIWQTKTENPHGVTVENSILGEAGLRPTLDTLEAGHRLALANKESLVVGGELVMALSRRTGNEILPVDSEHCAIFQCLRAGARREVRHILLTASGGPFFGYTAEQLKSVTKQMTLAHPTWRMGQKITVDSATLMNKGFEVIEAVHLFGVTPDQVRVVVHRESVVHSMVEYVDNSIIAQLSVPDMRHCVQYALTHPHRLPAGESCAELDLFSVGKLTFSRPDTETFPLLPHAVSCIRRGGALPAVLNAANEEIVDAFLHEQIRFYDIPDLVMRVTDQLSYAEKLHSYEEILSADRAAREAARALLSRM